MLIRNVRTYSMSVYISQILANSTTTSILITAPDKTKASNLKGMTGKIGSTNIKIKDATDTVVAATGVSGIITLTLDTALTTAPTVSEIVYLGDTAAVIKLTGTMTTDAISLDKVILSTIGAFTTTDALKGMWISINGGISHEIKNSDTTTSVTLKTKFKTAVSTAVPFVITTVNPYNLFYGINTSAFGGITGFIVFMVFISLLVLFIFISIIGVLIYKMRNRGGNDSGYGNDGGYDPGYDTGYDPGYAPPPMPMMYAPQPMPMPMTVYAPPPPAMRYLSGMMPDYGPYQIPEAPACGLPPRK